MPTTDPTFGWTVPEDADALADGAAAIRTLAADIAADIPLVQYGSLASASISATTSTNDSVTFPRAYASPPTVVVSHGATGNNDSKVFAYAQQITATGFTLTRRAADSTSIAGAMWIAVGPPA